MEGGISASAAKTKVENDMTAMAAQPIGQGGHHCVGLPEAIPQKHMDVPGPKIVTAKRAIH
eukprot:1160350-Pelagomonas_calceolata.AAC.1